MHFRNGIIGIGLNWEGWDEWDLWEMDDVVITSVVSYEVSPKAVAPLL